MAYEPLHHKYRPQTFGDLVGQETISLTLSNALAQERIAPAYLFTGPRGTGKTSSARILAKSLNCLSSSKPTAQPCGECEVCLAIAKGSALDVTEIDAASNTGVDNIREIIERSRFAPVQCRYKIYAIDECHMLSTAAFNALLKTLEEPPPQVVFILATTDPQRVLSTIISRCQRFDYRRIPLADMTRHLRYIADNESIAIADDALTLIAQIANGGLRDAESLLDQLSLLPDVISVPMVWELVGAVPEQDLLKLLRVINRNDSLGVLQQCRSLLDRGREPLVVLQNLASFYLNLLIAKTAPHNSELTAVTESCWQELCSESQHWQTSMILRGQQQLKDAETQLKRTTQPRLWLEVTLLGLFAEAQAAISATPVPVPNSVPNQTAAPIAPVAPVATPPPVAEVVQTAAPKVELQTVPATSVQTPSSTAPIATPSPEIIPTVAGGANLGGANLAKNPVAQNPTIPNAESALRAEVVAPNLNPDPAANQEIWSKVVACLQPPTTQALLKQQCHLVNFDGHSAIVGVSSAKLQKMTQQKIPNIEAAFAQVCQHKVRVQLEVANPKANIAKNSIASVSPPIVEIASSPGHDSAPSISNNQQLNAVSPEPVHAHSQTASAQQSPLPAQGISAASRYQSLPSNIAERPEVPIIETPKVDAAPIVSSQVSLPSLEKKTFDQPQAELAKPANYGDEQLQQAINNLTLSFEGEIVQLDNLQDESIEIVDEQIKNTEPAEEKTLSSFERPDSNDYDDDW